MKKILGIFIVILLCTQGCTYFKKTVKNQSAILKHIQLSCSNLKEDNNLYFSSELPYPNINPVQPKLLKYITQEISTIQAYRQLHEVLQSYVCQSSMPYILKATRCAFEYPLLIEYLASDLTQITDTVVPFEMACAYTQKACHELISYDQSLIIQKTLYDDISKYNSIESIILLLVEILKQSGQQNHLAFKAVEHDELDNLKHESPQLLDFFIQNTYLKRTDAEKFLLAAKKLNFSFLFKSYMELLQVISPDVLELIQQIFQICTSEYINTQEWSGNFFYANQTDIGLILIGDVGTNHYKTQAALIIDFGGDDMYSFPEKLQSNELLEMMPNVIIDFSGNDTYQSNEFGGLAGGLFHPELLLDLNGNDHYESIRVGCGSGVFGVGMLIDMAGNDVYLSQEIGQGSGLFGYGLLLDVSGNDSYKGAKFIQGFGGPSGIGQLIDVQGDDTYEAGGKYSCSYGVPGMYEAQAQGVGWGFRKMAAGGIGTLIDVQGNDTYKAGNFSQGIGYFLGIGILRDDSGNDQYDGSRYCQGTSAHMACGVLMDFFGNDLYSGKIAANQGAAWDLSIAYLLDYQGNDQYQGTDLSLGSAAQNGFGVFVDSDGKDYYSVYPDQGLGVSGKYEYEGGRGAGNFAVFMDLGGKSDQYSVVDCQNNQQKQTDNMGIFIDE
ncbi:MAG: hypothetical protein HQK77_01885 [Desulfobacterales bacterium]|nr:hypothetical protein [Desulfobacterales bacterium]